MVNTMQRIVASSEPEFHPLRLSTLRWHSEDEIPDGVRVLDYPRLIEGGYAQELKTALTHGCPFYIRDYGISEEESEAVYNVTRAFFNQPEDEKSKMVHPTIPLILRGYSAYGTGAYENSLDGGKAINQYVKYAWGPSDNVYPNATFKCMFESMIQKLTSVSNGVVNAIGDVLDMKGHSQWPHLFDGEDTVLHCQCYYPEKPRGGGRMISHADASTVTLLNQLPAENGHVGLKAKLGHEYVGIPAIRGTLVVLTGESLNAITNGRAKPVIHAVAGPTKDIDSSERSSMPFFANPRNALKMSRPEDTTHGKFYNASGITTFADYSKNIATAYAQTEGAQV